MAHDVFISYSAQDKPIADAACATIEARGIRCWMAPRDVTGGLDWSEGVIDAISGSALVVLTFSANSNACEQVKREVERAVSKGLPVLPFRIEDVPSPSTWSISSRADTGSTPSPRPSKTTSGVWPTPPGSSLDLTSLYTTLFPGRGSEAYLFTVFPWLQPVNLLGKVAGLLGNVLLLIGVRWMIVSKPGGVNVAAGACRFLAVVVLVWFVFALGTTLTTGRRAGQAGGLVTAILQTAALAWGQIFVVWALIRWSTRRLTPGPRRP